MAPIKPKGALDEGSYTVRYFEAEQAQLMADAPSRPEDIITDYAVGMYFGNVNSTDATVSEWNTESYDSLEKQAEIMTRQKLLDRPPDGR